MILWFGGASGCLKMDMTEGPSPTGSSLETTSNE